MDNATKYYTCHIKITKITKKNSETIGLNIFQSMAKSGSFHMIVSSC